MFPRYPELRGLFLQQLKVDIQSSCLPVTALRLKFKEYASGKLPHAQDAIVTLYDLLHGDRTLGSSGGLPPSSQLPLISSPPTGKNTQDWAELKNAIVGSLYNGSFIDSKFYAPVTSSQPENSPNLQPLYFCGSVNLTIAQNLSSGTVLHYILVY